MPTESYAAIVVSVNELALAGFAIVSALKPLPSVPPTGSVVSNTGCDPSRFPASDMVLVGFAAAFWPKGS